MTKYPEPGEIWVWVSPSGRPYILLVISLREDTKVFSLHKRKYHFYCLKDKEMCFWSYDFDRRGVSWFTLEEYESRTNPTNR